MISRAEGVTVYTVQSNPKSKWPLLCQILGTMCYSPVCSVSLRLKQQIGCALTALAVCYALRLTREMLPRFLA